MYGENTYIPPDSISPSSSSSPSSSCCCCWWPCPPVWKLCLLLAGGGGGRGGGCVIPSPSLPLLLSSPYTQRYIHFGMMAIDTDITLFMKTHKYSWGSKDTLVSVNKEEGLVSERSTTDITELSRVHAKGSRIVGKYSIHLRR